MKLFGNLARAMPREIFQNYQVFVQYLFDVIVSDYMIDKSVHVALVFDTLIFMCGSNQAKICLVNGYSAILFDQAYPQIVWYLRNSITNLQLKALDFLSALFSTNTSDSNERDIDLGENFKLTKNLFDQFLKSFNLNYQLKTSGAYHDKFFDYLIKLAQLPFLEKRLAVQHLYKCLCESEWGIAFLFASLENGQSNDHVDAFLRYLLDRSTELESEGRLSKFELIKTITASLTIVKNTFLNAKQFESLISFIKHGPYHANRELAVAFESS
jgi:hypothetical protein